MGKEARAWGQLTDGESDGKLLWEPPKLIFRGAVRGIRLISYDSLMAYLEKAYQESSGSVEVEQ